MTFDEPKWVVMFEQAAEPGPAAADAPDIPAIRGMRNHLIMRVNATTLQTARLLNGFKYVAPPYRMVTKKMWGSCHSAFQVLEI